MENVFLAPMHSVHHVSSQDAAWKRYPREKREITLKGKRGLTLPVLVVPALLRCYNVPGRPFQNGLTLVQQTVASPSCHSHYPTCRQSAHELLLLERNTITNSFSHIAPRRLPSSHSASLIRYIHNISEYFPLTTISSALLHFSCIVSS